MNWTRTGLPSAFDMIAAASAVSNMTAPLPSSPPPRRRRTRMSFAWRGASTFARSVVRFGHSGCCSRSSPGPFARPRRSRRGRSACGPGSDAQAAGRHFAAPARPCQRSPSAPGSGRDLPLASSSRYRFRGAVAGQDRVVVVDDLQLRGRLDRVVTPSARRPQEIPHGSPALPPPGCGRSTSRRR